MLDLDKTSVEGFNIKRILFVRKIIARKSHGKTNHYTYIVVSNDINCQNQ